MKKKIWFSVILALVLLAVISAKAVAIPSNVQCPRHNCSMYYTGQMRWDSEAMKYMYQFHCTCRMDCYWWIYDH